MKRKIKNIFKLLLAVFSTVVLLGLSGLWRLSSSPFKFDAHSPLLQYVPNSIKFSEVFLRAGKFYTIPELEFREVYFRTSNIEIRAPRLVASWNLWHLLRGDLRISYVRFEEAEVQIQDEKPTPQNEFSSMGEALNKVFENIPVKYLEITKGKIFFEYEGKAIQIDQANLYVLKLPKVTNFQVSGFLKEELIRPFEFSLQGQVESVSHSLKGKIECKKIVLADLPLPAFIKEYSQFYRDPLDVEVIMNDFPQDDKLSLKGRVTFSLVSSAPTVVGIEGKKNGSQLALNISSSRISVKALPKIWLPVAQDMRRWVFDSIPQGMAHNVDLNFVFQKSEKGEWVVKDSKGTLEATDTTVLYLKKDLPPLEGVKAHLFFNKEKALIQLKRGHIKDLEVEDSEIALTQLQQPVTHLNGKINFHSPFSRIVWYMNHGFLKKHMPATIKAKSGHVKGQIHLSLPLKKTLTPSEVKLGIETNLKNGNLSVTYDDRTFLLKGIDLSLEKNPEKLKIAGSGNIEGFQSNFVWEEYTQENAPIKSQKKIKGSGQFKGLLAMLPSSIQAHLQSPKGGEAVLSFASQERKEGLTKIDVDLDLTQSSVSLPLLNWTKPKGESAKLEIDIETKNNKIQQLKRGSFLSRSLKAQTNVRFDDQGKVSEVYFEPLIVNGMKGTGKAFLKNGIWEIVMRIPFLNFNPILTGLNSSAPDSSQKKDASSFNLNLKVGTLFFKKNYVYKNLDISAKIRKDELHFLRLTGEDQGEPLFVRYQPHEDQMVLELEIPCLDTLLTGLDISDQIKSKKVQIQASKPLSDLDRPIKGKLFIDQLKVLDAPFFAKLLSLVSIEGLLNTLKGKGLVFDDNYAKFEYKDQKIALRRSRLMNSSIGITAKGYVDLKAKTLDLEGVLVPANFLNQLVGKIPLIGSFLTGGKDQGLFSVSYSAKGDLKKPEIKSNPLGVVAPNVLKSLFGDITGTKKEKPTLVENPA